MTTTPAKAAAVLFALAVAGPALAPAGVAAQEFSADVLNKDAKGIARRDGKLSVSGPRIRLETTQAAGGYLLAVSGTRPAVFVQPQSQVALIAEQPVLPARLLVPVDPDNPCLAWQALPKAAAGAGGEWRCARSDGDDRNRVASYLATSPEGRVFAVAIDRDLRFPVSLRSQDGTVLEVANVVLGPQSPDLFVVPANYQKFTLQGLIERMKHADVWGASTPDAAGPPPAAATTRPGAAQTPAGR